MFFQKQGSSFPVPLNNKRWVIAPWCFSVSPWRICITFIWPRGSLKLLVPSSWSEHHLHFASIRLCLALLFIISITEYGSIMTNSIYWPIKQCLKMRIEIRVIWQCLSLSFEETWEINIAKKEFSNTVLWVWRVLAYFCRKNEDLTENFVLLAFMSVIHLFI